MGLFELFIIAVGLSMDAFAVAICMGLSMKKATFKKALTIGLYFGVFQAAMPVIGFLTASLFADKIINFDHWVAFILLGFLGFKMFVGAFEKETDKPEAEKTEEAENKQEADLRPSKMLPFAIATSIDAMAAGISFAFLNVNIVPAASFIGITTLTFSMVGVKIGNVFGAKFKSKAEMAGGIILVAMGTKILVEHLTGGA